MVKIDYSKVKKKIVDNDFREKFVIVDGKTASGKTTLAIEKYKRMIEKENINSEDILVFIMNTQQSLAWKKELVFNTCGQMKINTFQGFITKELLKYWPIVEKNCSEIKNARVKPEFVSADAANYMMRILVDYFRNKKGYFTNITATSRRIGENLVSNIKKAATAMIGIDEIGTRIYNSLQVKGGIDKKIYDQMDEVISHYINSFLKQGALDQGISIYLYNKYLLKDEMYRNHLKKLKYLLVDDFNETPPAQLNLINLISKNLEMAYLFKNADGTHGTFNGADLEFLDKNINFVYEEIKLESNFSSNERFIQLTDKIDNLNLTEVNEIIEEIPLYIDISSQLRSEMIEKIALKAKELIDEGINPKDITIVSPANDSILSYEIEHKLKSISISVLNSSKKTRLIDNPFVHCLVVIASLCKKFNKINLTVDDYRRFFSIFLELDLINASIIAKVTENNKGLQDLEEKMSEIIGINKYCKYAYLKEWIESFIESNKNNEIPLQELLRRAFLELLITLPEARENISVCKNLSELAEKFIGTLVQFNTLGDQEEKFLEYVRSEAEDFYSLREFEELLINSNGIVVTDIYRFLTYNLNSKFQIWADISSNLWSPRNAKELTNDYVLRTGWNINDIYTDEIEETIRQRNLYTVVKCLMRRCSERIYVYGSEYSVSGYEQDSYLSEMIMNLFKDRGVTDAV